MNIIPSISKTAQSYSAVSVGARKMMKLVAVIGITSALGFMLAVAWYSVSMQHRVLYGVSLGGASYSGQSLASLPYALGKQVAAIEHQPLSIGETATTTTLADLGIQLDAAQAIHDVSGIGRQGSVLTQLVDTFSLLVRPKPLVWTITSSPETADRLAQVVHSTLVEGTEASYGMAEDGTVIIVPEHDAVRVDVPATLSGIRTSFFRGTPTVLYVQTSTYPATITQADLAPLLPSVRVITNEPVTITQGKKTATATQADMLAWLRVNKQSNGVVTVAVNADAVATWLDAVAPSISTNPVTQQVSSIDGTILRQGKEGVAINTVETSQRIVTALQTTSSATPHTIVAAMTTVPVTVQTITPEHDTTPGLFPDKYVEVDLSSQMLYQYEGEQLIHSYRVSTGKASTPTPIGTFSINDKTPRAYSSTFGLYMPYWMPFIGSTYGLHALPQWPNGYTEGASHIGTPVSHGCVRLSSENAAALYDWATVGTHVVIHR